MNKHNGWCFFAALLLLVAWSAVAAEPDVSAPQVGAPAHNERMVPADLRAVVGAQTAFNAATGHYAASFAELSAPAQGPPYLTGAWDKPRRGYVFQMAPAANGQPGYAVTAAPWKPGVTGKTCFFADESGVIRVNASGAAGPDSTPGEAKSDQAPVPPGAAPVIERPGAIMGTLWRWVGYQPPLSRAIGNIRTIIGASVAYNSATGRYPETFKELTHPPSGPAFLDSDESKCNWPLVGGFRFTFMPVPDPAVSFVVVGEPVGQAPADTRWLYTDQTGVIRWSTTADIGPDSPPIG